MPALAVRRYLEPLVHQGIDNFDFEMYSLPRVAKMHPNPARCDGGKPGGHCDSAAAAAKSWRLLSVIEDSVQNRSITVAGYGYRHSGTFQVAASRFWAAARKS